MEALLHNLFAYTYVLHVHPTLVNGLTCGKGAKELSEQLLGKDVLWIDICKPGVYAESFGGPLHMTDDITYFITHWEAEAYRSKK